MCGWEIDLRAYTARVRNIPLKEMWKSVNIFMIKIQVSFDWRPSVFIMYDTRCYCVSEMTYFVSSGT